MIKNICICDKCGKEKPLKSIDYIFSDKTNKNYDLWDLPEQWKRIGILPQYTLCPECTYKLSLLQQDVETEFMKITYLTKSEEK